MIYTFICTCGLLFKVRYFVVTIKNAEMQICLFWKILQ